MKKLTSFLTCLSLSILIAQAQLASADFIPLKDGNLSIQPVKHASLVLNYKQKNIYVDPSGGADLFKGLGNPDVIIITDIHGDHFDLNTLKALQTSKAVFVVPKAVADKIPAELYKEKLVILNNGDKASVGDIEVAAIPMYNLPEAPDAFHTKGRGNGYVLTIGDKRIYISGDTEDIPEMRALKDIDVAFVCMNLPYTMEPKQAASAVLDFSPTIVYPYHYRGQSTNDFKQLVDAGGKPIDVRLKEWYPTTTK
jgi:L-ascorbate metabolism protein UlaG (beta-lactamase superfamily)